MGFIKNNPRSILLAWSGIIAVGFGSFVYAKDLVSNERRAEEIRRIKRERRRGAYSHYDTLHHNSEETQPQAAKSEQA
ncbi:hypothetical protein DL89DRAFT_269728 [Linderina pennispora]|uniref:Uncharacterized protein n=1 Tax=Linderina pennispora TaxID=61395 RepID=A0A1Y1W196_9FUNG|nr:uncharacterized protein DL89DRAFT_269728 [Linderina pennispora]ORX67309.1 hypothetical protein DL89DRAFT_269728 [Linderina pennispora]